MVSTVNRAIPEQNAIGLKKTCSMLMNRVKV